MSRPFNARALAANRSIIMNAKEASPVAYVEAISLAPDEKREAHIQAAAEQLVRAPSPNTAAREIVRAFLGKPPRHDNVPDEATPPGVEAGKAGAGKLTDPHMAHTPGQAHPESDEETEIGPLKKRPDADRRDVGELVNAIDVLVLAVRMLPTLTAEVHRASTQAASIAQRTNERSAQAQLLGGAQRLRDAIAAAGTVKIPERETDADDEATQEQFEKAFSAGQDADAAVRFAREYQNLCATGHAPSMPLQSYVQTNLDRLEKESRR